MGAIKYFTTFLLLLLYVESSAANERSCRFDNHDQVFNRGKLKECLRQVKREAANAKRYWFGQNWPRQCHRHRHKHTVGIFLTKLLIMLEFCKIVKAKSHLWQKV